MYNTRVNCIFASKINSIKIMLHPKSIVNQFVKYQFFDHFVNWSKIFDFFIQIGQKYFKCLNITLLAQNTKLIGFKYHFIICHTLTQLSIIIS